MELDAPTEIMWQPPPWPHRPPGGWPKPIAAAAMYSKTCVVIANNWNLDPEDMDRIVPAELRQTTPYSFAMLLHLRKLSIETSGNMSGAHELLMEQWGSRQHTEDHADGGWIDTDTDQFRRIPYKKWFEKQIKENTHGLMLYDIYAVVPKLKQRPSGPLQGSENPNKAERKELRLLARAERISATTRQNQSTVTAVSTSGARLFEESDNNQQTTRSSRTNDRRMTIEQMQDLEPSEPKTRSQKKARARTDNTLDARMSRLGEDRADDMPQSQIARDKKRYKEMRKNKLRSRQTGIGHVQSLPSERFQLGSLPPLRPMSEQMANASFNGTDDNEMDDNEGGVDLPLR